MLFVTLELLLPQMYNFSSDSPPHHPPLASVKVFNTRLKVTFDVGFESCTGGDRLRAA